MRMLLAFLLLFTTTSFAIPGYRLAWSDEFDYTGLPSSANWSYDIGGWGWGNGELQYYKAANPKNSWVDSGVLKITVQREDTTYTDWQGNTIVNHLSSARIYTALKHDWLYGRFEARMKLPTGTGMWPALWMVPASSIYGSWPDGGEIDILENYSAEPWLIHGSLHTKNNWGGSSITGYYVADHTRDSFHLYAMDWRADTISMSVDGVEYFRHVNPKTTYADWPFDQPFPLVLNVAVSGNWETISAEPYPQPQSLVVDYIRVYQRSAVPDSVTLTLTQTTGGTITATPAAAKYPIDASVQIKATPNTGYTFSGWAQGAAGKLATDNLALTTSQTISATFTKIPTPSPGPYTPYTPSGTDLPSVPGRLRSSWVGNTYAGRPPMEIANGDTTNIASGSVIPNYVDAMWVHSDGTAYTMSSYDESGKQGSFFKNGAVIGSTQYGFGQFPTRGDIVGDNRFIYVTSANVHGAWDNRGFGAQRFDRRGQNAGWDNVGGFAGFGFLKSSFSVRDTGAGGNDSKLAIDTNAHELYIYDTVGSGGRVHVFNLTTLNPHATDSFNLPGASKIVSDHAGSIWAIIGSEIRKYSNRGVYSGKRITNRIAPTCITMNASGELLVFDDSTLQLHFYNNLATTPTEETNKLFGMTGGIYGGIPGQVLPNKLLPLCTGIGTDAIGNLYFSWGSITPVLGTDVRSVKQNGELNWEVLGQPFASVAGFDPATDGKIVYYHLYADSIDYNGPPGTWSYKSFLWDRHASPGVPFNYVGGTINGYTYVRNMDGKKFVYLSASSQTANGFQIRRLDGQVFTPVGSITDGVSGWNVDIGGNIWKANDGVGSGKLFRYKYGGLTPDNKPDYSHIDTFPGPAHLGDCQRLNYDTLKDELIITGYTNEHPNPDRIYGRAAGKVMAKYSGYLRGGRTLAWIDTLPKDNFSPALPVGMPLGDLVVEGDYIFAITSVTNPAEIIYVYKTSDGSFVGVITPDHTLRGDYFFQYLGYGGLGWIDMIGGIQAFKRSNGEYIIQVEDDLNNKNVIHQWCPEGTCGSDTSARPITPKVYPNGGLFYGVRDVSITSEGADSIQVSEDSLTWTRYRSTVHVASNRRIFARSYRNGYVSPVAKATYVISIPQDPAANWLVTYVNNAVGVKGVDTGTVKVFTSNMSKSVSARITQGGSRYTYLPLTGFPKGLIYVRVYSLNIAKTYSYTIR